MPLRRFSGISVSRNRLLPCGWRSVRWVVGGGCPSRLFAAALLLCPSKAKNVSTASGTDSDDDDRQTRQTEHTARHLDGGREALVRPLQLVVRGGHDVESLVVAGRLSNPKPMQKLRPMLTATSSKMSFQSKILRTANAPNTPPTEIEQTIAQALLDLQTNVADLKSELTPLQISAAKEVDVKGGKKAVVIFVPVPQAKAFHKVQQR